MGLWSLNIHPELLQNCTYRWYGTKSSTHGMRVRKDRKSIFGADAAGKILVVVDYVFFFFHGQPLSRSG
jgi:hypothetical protein